MAREIPTPHYDKLKAALGNPKCIDDIKLLNEAIQLYKQWIGKMASLKTKNKMRVREMVDLLNWYKNEFEIELIMKKGSDFLRRQKGQLKLDNSILEEFLIHLINPDIFNNLKNLEKLSIGPQNAFMSLAFTPRSVQDLVSKPELEIKTKDQDFTIGAEIHYKFSSTKFFEPSQSINGSFNLAVLATECKINLDKTMYQEAAGTAYRLKQGCPISKYYVIVEYLDMSPEDCRLTAIDNVFLLRHVKRLPFEKRDKSEEVEKIHKENPIDPEVMWKFVVEIEQFIEAVWYDPDEVLRRGSIAPS